MVCNGGRGELAKFFTEDTYWVSKEHKLSGSLPLLSMIARVGFSESPGLWVAAFELSLPRSCFFTFWYYGHALILESTVSAIAFCESIKIFHR